MATAALLGVSLATTLIGSGIQAYSQQQEAANTQRVADYNYKIAQTNAATQQAVLTQQAAWQQQANQVNQQAQANNATQLDYQADAVAASGAQEVARQRERNQRVLATQRAQYAKSGVTSEGSPLTVMAEQASIMELGVQDLAWDSNNKAKVYRDQAAETRYQSQLSLLDQAQQSYTLAAQQTGIGLDLQSAAIGRSSAYSSAAGQRTASYGTILNGIGSAVGSYSNYQDRLNTNKLYKAA